MYYIIKRKPIYKNYKTDRDIGILSIDKICENFKMTMINEFLNSLSIQFKLNSNDKDRLDIDGLTIVYKWERNGGGCECFNYVYLPDGVI